MTRAKQRPKQHLIDQEGQRLMLKSLPKGWLAREYKPDYGLDYAIEVFGVDQLGGSHETFGEHFFVQLKSCEQSKVASIPLYHRLNVEKYPLQEAEREGEIEVVKFSLEASELVTIQRMGAAVPVLLVIADVTVGECYFVCVNDYIDKILIPQHGQVGDSSRVIYVPKANRLDDTMRGHAILRWYAKRPKLYAAFTKIFYQRFELASAESKTEAVRLAEHFAKILLQFDFWNYSEVWPPLAKAGAALRRFNDTGTPSLFDGGPQPIDVEVVVLWDQLALLPRLHEEISREAFLPLARNML